MSRKKFLTAEWRYLVMLNYAVERETLQPLTPRGTELDLFNNETFLSVVGFRFERSRIFGIPIPFHTNFSEVNLRFYVRRKMRGEWRRGVVFVRELVPRPAIAFVARTVYGEPYSAVPMRHKIERAESSIRIEYSWRHAGQWESVGAAADGEPQFIEPGSQEEFITEHYWGYTSRGESCHEYQVEHPRWRVWQATEAELKSDISKLYGDRFLSPLSARPTTAFIADGSPVTVWKSTVLP